MKHSRIKLLPLLVTAGELVPPLTTMLGVENDKTAIFACIDAEDAQSIVIVGSEENRPQPLLRTMLAALALTNTPQMMKIGLVNLGSSVRCCAQLPHMWNGRAGSPERAAKLLALVLQELDRRITTTRPYPALLIAIDDLAACDSLMVGEILRRGPALKVYMIAATTGPVQAQELDFAVTIESTEQPGCFALTDADECAPFEAAWISPNDVERVAYILRKAVKTPYPQLTTA